MSEINKHAKEQSAIKGQRNAAALSGYDGQIVLVFQGGGALGAFQAGVYQALHEAGVEPDWIIGTSIGAINGSLIAGNESSERISALQEFWDRVAHKSSGYHWPGWEQVAQSLSNLQTVSHGIPNFFEPFTGAFLGAHVPLGAENAGYYSTAPLKRTLGELVNFSVLRRKTPRLTVGAAQVRTSTMRYFDSRDEDIDIRHILASGALPPAFPAIRIDGDLYWDGGILSNTPAEVIFDDYQRRSSLIFAVHLWNPTGDEPQTMWQVAHRQKDIQYSSRVAAHISRLQQTHRLRHVIRELMSHIPEGKRESEDVQALGSFGCLTRMHIVRLLAPGIANQDHTKDIDFSRSGIRARWEAGRTDTLKVLEKAPWRGEFDPLAGIVLHEAVEKLQSKLIDPDLRNLALERSHAAPTDLPLQSHEHCNQGLD